MIVYAGVYEMGSLFAPDACAPSSGIGLIHLVERCPRYLLSCSASAASKMPNCVKRTGQSAIVFVAWTPMSRKTARWAIPSQTKISLGEFPKTRLGRRNICMMRAGSSDGAGESSTEAVDISVFQFTLGVPGFDDSDLPRVLGIALGGLLILNHAVSLTSITPAQLRSEAVGLVLAAVSISLSFIGQALEGKKTTDRQGFGPDRKQIFFLADSLTELQRQDLAWASYNLLRNTSTTAMLVWHTGQVACARGFWGSPKDSGSATAAESLILFNQKLDSLLGDLSNLREPLYLPVNADAQGWEIIPKGTVSVLVQPFPKDSCVDKDSDLQGFLFLISNTPRGYSKKDRLWTASLAKKLWDVLHY